MKRYILALLSIAIMSPQLAHGFFIPDPSELLAKALKKSQQVQSIKSKYQVFLGFQEKAKKAQETVVGLSSIAENAKEQAEQKIAEAANIKKKVTGVLDNPGSTLANYKVVDKKEVANAALSRIQKYSSNPAQRLQANTINTLGDLNQTTEIDRLYAQELLRVLDKTTQEVNKNALQSQQQQIDAESQRDAQSEITKNLNEEMDKILKLVDKICTYQNNQIPCFPNLPQEPTTEA